MGKGKVNIGWWQPVKEERRPATPPSVPDTAVPVIGKLHVKPLKVPPPFPSTRGAVPEGKALKLEAEEAAAVGGAGLGETLAGMFSVQPKSGSGRTLKPSKWVSEALQTQALRKGSTLGPLLPSSF